MRHFLFKRDVGLGIKIVLETLVDSYIHDFIKKNAP